MYKAIFIFGHDWNGAIDHELNASRVKSLKEHFDIVYGEDNYLLIDGHTEDTHLDVISAKIKDVDEYTKFFVMAHGTNNPFYYGEKHQLFKLHSYGSSGENEEAKAQNTIEYINGLKGIFEEQCPGKTMNISVMSCSSASIIPYIDTTNLHLIFYGAKTQGVWIKECMETLRKVVSFDADHHSVHSATVGAIIHSHEEINVVVNNKHLCIKPRSEQHNKSIYHDIIGEMNKYQDFINSTQEEKMDYDFTDIALPKVEDPKDTVNFYYRKQDIEMLSKALVTPEIKQITESSTLYKLWFEYYMSGLFLPQDLLISMYNIKFTDPSTPHLYDKDIEERLEDIKDSIETNDLLYEKLYTKILSNATFIESDYFLASVSRFPFTPNMKNKIFSECDINDKIKDIVLEVLDIEVFHKNDINDKITNPIINYYIALKNNAPEQTYDPKQKYIFEISHDTNNLVNVNYIIDNTTNNRVIYDDDDIDNVINNVINNIICDNDINKIYSALKQKEWLESEYYGSLLFDVAKTNPSILKDFIHMSREGVDREDIDAYAVESLECSNDFSNDYKYPDCDYGF